MYIQKAFGYQVQAYKYILENVEMKWCMVGYSFAQMCNVNLYLSIFAIRMRCLVVLQKRVSFLWAISIPHA